MRSRDISVPTRRESKPAEHIFEILGYQLPSENWHTNCLAFFLGLESNLRDSILASLTGLELHELSALQNLTVTSYPMLPENNRIADVIVKDTEANFLVLIENKIDSPVDPDQIDSYFRYQIDPLIAHGWRALLVLLTQQDEHGRIAKFEGRQNFKYLRWLDVYRTLADYKSRNVHVNLLITAFLQHLRLRGMEPPRGFRWKYGNSWLHYVDFKTNAFSVLERVKSKTEKKAPGFVSEGPREELLEQVPFLGYYLYFKSIKDQKRKKFQMWLGFEQEIGHPLMVAIEIFFYPPVDYYKKTVMEQHGKQLSRWAARLKRSGWGVEFGDDIEAPPLWKERPLVEVIGNSRKFEDQCDAVQRFFTDSLAELAEAGTLKFVKETLRDYQA